MKKLRVLIIIIILSGTLSSVSQTQESIYLDSLHFKTGVKEYYDNIKKAELQIIRGNYSKASLYYSKAFKYKEPFSIDLHRAIISEYLSDKDSAKVVNYFMLGLKIRHCPTNIKEKMEEYANYYPELTKKQYWKSLPKLLDTVKIEYLRNNNLSAALDSLLEADQKVRKEGIVKYTKPKLYKQPYADTIKAIDSINITKLILLWGKYGEISERNSPSAESNLEVLLIHATAWHDMRWLQHMKTEVCNGTLDNKVYSRLVDRCFEVEYSQIKTTEKSDFFDTSLGFTLYDKYLMFCLSKKQEKEVNKRRKQIYLCSIQEEQERCLWQFRQKNTNFNTDFLFFTYSYLDIEENATDEMIKGYIIEQDKIINQL